MKYHYPHFIDGTHNLEKMAQKGPESMKCLRRVTQLVSVRFRI